MIGLLNESEFECGMTIESRLSYYSFLSIIFPFSKKNILIFNQVEGAHDAYVSSINMQSYDVFDGS